MGENATQDKQPKVSFSEGVKAEFKKISWPDKKTLGKQTITVTVTSIVVGCIIAVIDMVIQYGINFLTM
ncbi:MAG: preprotein translocase subunit SecE [Lachnospiraceae bacterium]|nr:preprotein translocase subunit SecE [Lachnospiraceae bacterium]